MLFHCHRVIGPAILAAALFAAAACSSDSGTRPEPVPNPLAPSVTPIEEITTPEPTSASLLDDAQRSDAVVVAEVVSLGPAPGRWNRPCSVQGATYKVVETLRGTVPQGELRVAHKICLSQPLIDNKTVGLSTTWFHSGRRVVMFLELDPEGRAREPRADGEWVSQYAVFDERAGVLPDDEALRADVVKAVATAAKGRTTGGGDPFGGRHRR